MRLTAATAGALALLLTTSVADAASFELKKLQDPAPDAGANAAQALSILDLVFQCVSPRTQNGEKAISHEFTWKGDRDFFQVNDWRSELVFDKKINRATVLPSTIIGEMTSRDITVSANFAMIASVADESGLELRCAAGQSCIALESKFGGRCGASARNDCEEEEEGDDSYNPPARSVPAIRMSGICSAQVASAVTAIEALMVDARARAAKTAADLYEVTGLPAEYTIPIREQPDKDTFAIGQIAAASGPVALSGCRVVSGYKNPWCKVRVGAIEGWVSKTRFVPYLP